MKEREIKAVLFDIGGVLQIPNFLAGLVQDTHLVGIPKNCGHRNQSVHEFIADKLKVLLDQWFDAIDTSYAMSIEGKISRKKAIKEMSENLNVSEKKFSKFVVIAYKKNFSLNKQLFKQVKKLKKLGYKVGILSDQWYLSKDALMPKPLTKHFNPVIVSCDVKLRKPNPRIYKLAAEKLKLSPRQILFIDNQIWNLNPAKKLGFKTIRFKDNERLFKNKTWKSLFKQPV